MSQSPANPQATDQQRYQEAWERLGEQILRGRSFSGRERHHAFINIGNGQFVEASAAVGIDYAEDGRALAIGDLDDDGDSDVVISHRSAPRLRLLRNDAPRGHVLGLRLIGLTGNADAIGAQVRVIAHAADGTQRGPFVAAVTAGDGFLAQSSAELRIGVGDATAIDDVQVRWPGGAVAHVAGAQFGPVQELLDGSLIGTKRAGGLKSRELATHQTCNGPGCKIDLILHGPFQVDAAYTLRQGEAAAHLRKKFDGVAIKPPLLPLQLAKPGTARVFFAARVPLPPLPYLATTGPKQLAPRPGHAQLVVLWASWCKPCATELRDLNAHQAELEAAGIDVLAVSVDAVAANQPPDATAAHNWALSLGFAGQTGAATSAMVAAIEGLHAFLTLSRQPLPLPTSLLVDRRGDLAAIYKGAVHEARVVADAAVDDTPAQRAKAEVVSPDGVHLAQGQWLNPQRDIHYVELTDALVHAGLRNLAVAVLDLRRRMLPTTALACNDLGVALAKLGEVAKAEPLFARAVQLAPDNQEARDNWARARAELAGMR